MLRKENRLLKGERLRNEKTINTPFAVIKIEDSEEKESKFGFIVSKKIDKRAVIRNSIRRRIRAAVEELLDQIEPSKKVLFIIKKEGLNIDYEEILNTLTRTFRKEGLLK